MVLELPIEQAGLPVGPGDADQLGVVERSHSAVSLSFNGSMAA